MILVVFSSLFTLGPLGSSTHILPDEGMGICFISKMILFPLPSLFPHRCLWCLDYMPFKPLTCQICGFFLWLCTWNCCHQKHFFNRNAANIVSGRAAPGPAGGAYSTPPDPLVGLRALLLRVGREKGKGEGWPTFWNPKYATGCVLS